ncbi:transcriptional regulator [Opitutaceae bacterium TAV1]|nr:transcriptional regulator [Opitutaceae bacterium TAV1]
MKSSTVPSGRITLSEIAARAGTSTTTVSFVLNETGAVGAETRTRVLAAAKELGYRMRPRAGRTRPAGNALGTVTFIWVNTTEAWRQTHLAHLLLHTIGTGVEALGGRLRTLFYNEHENPPRPDFGDDEALLIAGTPGPGFLRLLPARLPRLNVICKPYVTPTSFLDLDSAHTGYALTRYLLEHGHRRIGFVSNSRFHRSFGLRYLGYLNALDDLDVPSRPEWVLRLKQPAGAPVETAQPASDIEPGLAKMLARKDRPTAIFAANDWMAAAVYQYAQRQGLSIPGDLSIVGCDNDPGICDLLKPGLTTHTLPYAELAREAVQWIAALVAGKPPHRQQGIMLFRGKLVERESVRTL